MRRVTIHRGLAALSAFAISAGMVTVVSDAGSASAASSSKTIQIVWETALSGATAAYTIPTLHGAQLAISQVNANGGVDGKKLALDVYDDGGSPTTAADLATKYSGNPAIVAGLGLIFGPETAAALKVTNKAGMPFISFRLDE